MKKEEGEEEEEEERKKEEDAEEEEEKPKLEFCFLRPKSLPLIKPNPKYHL